MLVVVSQTLRLETAPMPRGYKQCANYKYGILGKQSNIVSAQYGRTRNFAGSLADRLL